MSAYCHERLTWPIDASRGGVARWKVEREMASVRALRWRGVWLDLGWILRMRAYYYPGECKSAADPSRFRD